jgi:hypothetical protein
MVCVAGLLPDRVTYPASRSLFSGISVVREASHSYLLF